MKKKFWSLYLKYYTKRHPIAVFDIENDIAIIGDERLSTFACDCDGSVESSEDGRIVGCVTGGPGRSPVFESTTTRCDFVLTKSNCRHISRTLESLVLAYYKIKNPKVKVFVILRDKTEREVLQELLDNATLNKYIKVSAILPSSLSIKFDLP